MNRTLATCAIAAALAATLSLLLTAAVDLQASPGAHGPNGEHLDAPGAGSNPAGVARLPDGSVNVPMASQRRMVIRTRVAPETDAAASVELLGKVANDPNAGGLVQATSSGRIEPGPGGLPVIGQTVKRGQVLGYVRYNADPYARSEQQSRLAELRSNRQLARQKVARLESLADVVPRKEIEQARAELQAFSSSERSVGAGLAGREPLIAPVSGVIAQASVITGQVVEVRDVLFQIVDPAHLLIEATTADPTLAERIESARVAEAHGAQLQLVGAARSLRDGLIPMSFRAGADDEHDSLQLVVGQPVTVIAQLRERSKGYVLPNEAVVRNSANEPIVWIKSGAERYIPQPVQVRPLDARNVVVIQGLGEENRVVVQGAALIAQIR
ncbi:hypothetical protein CSC74_11305 [Pseudoxanthomonas yeongjuensis]|uniref:efflux RND transporter periplasmic adaptor subunit n=1 Tax=Pseudoxanthomonas yeongjuensis TaxID=377616 RepID=UPI001390F8E4|nr:HlyD family efflux transporter periplasmic adaptor subunit [Pseudoxanthomonas yeongjuensis]KAF1716410.1 hypothetical protein CSC74_11305 [Pseudoxanthomonas yeongjuensis]